jgi:hypothetical protein
VDAGGLYEGDLGSRDRKPIDEYLGEKAWLQIDLDNGLSQSGFPGTRAERLDDCRKGDRVPAAAKSHRQGHRRHHY